MEAKFPGAPPSGPIGQTVFAWLPGRQFLSQRWRFPTPTSPDGIAIIGLTNKRGAFVQHYFDSRGVARVYAMTLAKGVWRLLRATPDFSPLDFSQRFTGTFAQDGCTISRRWETSADGSTWAPRLRADLPATGLGSAIHPEPGPWQTSPGVARRTGEWRDRRSHHPRARTAPVGALFCSRRGRSIRVGSRRREAS